MTQLLVPWVLPSVLQSSPFSRHSLDRTANQIAAFFTMDPMGRAQSGASTGARKTILVDLYALAPRESKNRNPIQIHPVEVEIMAVKVREIVYIEGA